MQNETKRMINKVQKSSSRMDHQGDLRPSLTHSVIEEKPVKQSVDAHLKLLYDSQVLCDLNLILGEGKRCVQFPIHRVALTSRSDKYLAAMTDPASSSLREIRLPASVTSEEAVKQVISYLYTGQVRNIKEENVEDVFVISDHLDLGRLKANCLDFLSRFDDGNIFKYLKICRRLNLSALLDRILEYLKNNIDILYKSSNIEELTFDEFHSILGSKSVNELRRLQIAVDWLTSTGDYQWASTLLDCVDFTLLSPWDIERELMPLESRIKAHKDCVAFLRNVYKDQAVRMDSDTASSTESSSSFSPPRDELQLLPQLLVIGGVSDATTHPCEVGDHVFIGTEKSFGGQLSWKKAEQKAPPRRGHQAVMVGDRVYVLGGYSPSVYSIIDRPTNAVHCFHPRLQLWLLMSPMRVSRARFGVAHVKTEENDEAGDIYVFGGESMDPNGDDVIIITDTCEKYSIADNMWSNVRPLSLARSGIRACYHKDLIFVVGGQIEGKSLPLVECYHPQRHSWSSRQLLAEGLTDGCLISANEDQLFYIGGAHSSDGLGHEMISSSAIRQYNDSSDCWQTVGRLPRPLHHLSAALLGSKVYVVGGVCSEDASYNGDVIIFDYDQYAVDTSPFPLPIAFSSVSAFR